MTEQCSSYKINNCAETFGRSFAALYRSEISRGQRWALSSAGRAPALQAGGHRFEPYSAHHLIQINGKYVRLTRIDLKICGPVVQLVRMPACHAGGHRFEPGSGRQFFSNCLVCWCGSTVEQLICNQQVGGSIPSTSSKDFYHRSNTRL